MSGDTTSDDEGSQEDPPRYDIDDLEIIKTIGKFEMLFCPKNRSGLHYFITELSIYFSPYNFIFIILFT